MKYVSCRNKRKQNTLKTVEKQRMGEKGEEVQWRVAMLT
jgi:hypothetical protein